MLPERIQFVMSMFRSSSGSWRVTTALLAELQVKA